MSLSWREKQIHSWSESQVAERNFANLLVATAFGDDSDSDMSGAWHDHQSTRMPLWKPIESKYKKDDHDFHHM